MSEGVVIALIVLLPLIGGLAGYALPRLCKQMAIGTIILSLVLAVFYAFTQSATFIHHFEWIPGMTFGWQVDRISAAMLVLVSLISSLVHLFSASYMSGDKAIDRFYLKLGFFTFAMQGLLVADHLLLVFVFWELVGFASYLLIGFWFEEEKNATASRIAFMTNRVADAGFIMGLLLLWSNGGTMLISELEPLTYAPWVTLAGFGLLAGALGKSAQFPFFTWLPHAMAGPTPVSALIHAATMVAAGVYLLVRVYVIFTPDVMMLTATLGGMTALVAAVSALNQMDIKSVLAYSTISQLGYMVLGVGVGAFDMAFFHLWTHAFFKAGLFLSAGAVIHYLHHLDHDVDAQDMTRMGGLKKAIPFTFWAYLICMLALAGLPLFTGFLSKDGILAAAWDWHVAQSSSLSFLIPGMGLLAALLTAFYMGRQMVLVFLGEYRGDKELKLEKEPVQQYIPLIFLAIGSLAIWYSFNPIGHNFPFLDYLFVSRPEAPASSSIVALVSGVLAVTGLLTGYSLFSRRSKNSDEFTVGGGTWVSLTNAAFYLDWFYMSVIKKGFDQLSNVVTQIDKRMIDPALDKTAVGVVMLSKVTDLLDKLVVDGLVNLAANMSQWAGDLLRSFHTRRVQIHFVFALIATILIVIWLNLI